MWGVVIEQITRKGGKPKLEEKQPISKFDSGVNLVFEQGPDDIGLKVLESKLVVKQVDSEERVVGAFIKIRNICGINISTVRLDVTFIDWLNITVCEVQKDIRDLRINETKNVWIDVPTKFRGKTDKCCIKIRSFITLPCVAEGNDILEVQSHKFAQIEIPFGRGEIDWGIVIDVAVKNTSEFNIATAVFEIKFYDHVGNLMDVTIWKEYDIPAGSIRPMKISSKKVRDESDTVAKSYEFKVLRTISPEVEKFCLQVGGIKKSEFGEPIFRGIVRNMSSEMADAAIAVTFYNAVGYELFTNVVEVKGVESGAKREFEFACKSLTDDKPESWSVAIGEITKGKIADLSEQDYLARV
jgi:hypothetical protein